MNESKYIDQTITPATTKKISALLTSVSVPAMSESLANEGSLRCDGVVGLPALSSNQADILSHTSRTGRYVSDEEPDLITLTQRGYLRDHGAQPLAGGMHYYTMNPSGRGALNDHRQSACPISRQPQPNIRRSDTEGRSP